MSVKRHGAPQHGTHVPVASPGVLHSLLDVLLPLVRLEDASQVSCRPEHQSACRGRDVFARELLRVRKGQVAVCGKSVTRQKDCDCGRQRCATPVWLPAAAVHMSAPAQMPLARHRRLASMPSPAELNNSVVALLDRFHVL